MTIHDDQSLSTETRISQALGHEDTTTGAVVSPIHVSTTYARLDDYSLPDDRSYIRDHGLAQSLPEAMLCELEGGAQALSFSSGIAACTAAFHALHQGDHIAVSDTIYHGVLSWLEHFAEARGLKYTLFNASNLDEFANLIAHTPTKLVWFETPANPTWNIADIAAISEIAHQHEVIVAVDSTCATPVLCRPIEWGADLVCHSATKYLNGHSDVLAGMLVTAKDTPFWQRIKQHRLMAGPTLASLEAHLLVRGMRTLFLRVRKQCENAMALASYLESHRKVEYVCYPGLESNPGHEIAKKQMSGGYGGMLSVLIPGGREEAIAVACKARVFKRATSLGGVESLLEHRKTSESESTKTPENLIRISVGIEDINDLIQDWKQMLDG
ncbi:MAG: aminotransferase class V-fold PLP-dependent enzyme [Gammaproteobacteria bacterium]|nr:aminotransferase class V-fold PLP-dependent enzyme [Gammaproteobacteria bacterium]